MGDGLSTEFVLIDFENVQPKSLGLYKPGMCKIKLFLGQSQSKLPVELSLILQPFGSDVDYIRINGNGPNAVDFHIAFYIGQLAQAHPDARFTIVSKDTGFDPLVRHLATRKIPCKRVAAPPGAAKTATPTVAKPAAVKKAALTKAALGKNVVVTVLPGANGAAVQPKTTEALFCGRTQEIVTRLKGLKAARPATLKTLQSSLRSWFKPPMAPTEVASVIKSLTDGKQITLEGTKVKYTLGKA
jgi:hypothetical protein